MYSMVHCFFVTTYYSVCGLSEIARGGGGGEGRHGAVSLGATGCACEQFWFGGPTWERGRRGTTLLESPSPPTAMVKLLHVVVFLYSYFCREVFLCLPLVHACRSWPTPGADISAIHPPAGRARGDVFTTTRIYRRRNTIHALSHCRGVCLQ